MGRDTDLLRRLRSFGLDVVEVAGWQARGSATFNPRGSIDHHTAGSRNGNAPSLGICINGRAGLPGPLCNGFQARDNRIHLVAAGRANHGGTGGWRGLSGNSSVYGLERENVGTGVEPWHPDSFETAARFHAACLSPKGNSDLVCLHREWTPRKIDSVDTSGSRLRARVAELLRVGVTPTPQPPPEEDEMANAVIIRASAYTVALGWYRIHARRDGNTDPVGLGWWAAEIQKRETAYDLDLLELMFADLASRERT